MTGRAGVRDATAGPWPRPVRGQATVEFALVVPVVVVVALSLVQVGLVVHARVMVTHAAREGARVAAVGGTDGRVAEAVAVAGRLPPSRLRVFTDRSDGRVTVRVDYDAATRVPIVGALLGDVALTATATMRMERWSVTRERVGSETAHLARLPHTVPTLAAGRWFRGWTVERQRLRSCTILRVRRQGIRSGLRVSRCRWERECWV